MCELYNIQILNTKDVTSENEGKICFIYDCDFR